VRCALEAAPVRAAPEDDAEQVTQALLGEPLRVEERLGGWARIVTAYDYPGWIHETALEEGDGVLLQPLPEAPLEVARSLLGAPYEWGGLSKQGIDCSGLVHLAHRLTGILIPRDAWQQEEHGVLVPKGNARPGDLATYGHGGRADHVAFWLGEGAILHSTGRDRLGVVIEREPDELAATRRRFVRLPGARVDGKEDAGRSQTGDSR